MPSDCLVLHLVEPEVEDVEIFFIYDCLKNQYSIFGKRRNINKDTINYLPFRFSTSNINSLYNFTKTIMDDCCNFTLYNFTNLPDECSSISFDFLNDNREDTNELVGYIGLHFNLESFREWLLMLKKIKNVYTVA